MSQQDTDQEQQNGRAKAEKPADGSESRSSVKSRGGEQEPRQNGNASGNQNTGKDDEEQQNGQPEAYVARFVFGETTILLLTA